MGRPSNAALAERALAEQASLPKITYIPIHPGDPADTLWNRHRFRANVPVQVRDVPQGLTAVQMVEAARGNPWFAVEGEEQARAIPITPETPEQYRSYAIGWIRTAVTVREIESRWRNEEDLRVQCGVSDSEMADILGVKKNRLDIMKQAEALAQSAVNDD
jgi:hypothetical protein